MNYKVKCWILVEPEEQAVYSSKEEAEADRAQCQFLQPENIYSIVECEKTS